MIRDIEIETKYNADEIALKDFKEFCQQRKPDSYIEASGFDKFFTKPGEETAFCRLRIGPDICQLTSKRKTADTNNFIRTEYNLDLDRNTPPERISGFLEEFGYKYDTTIFKTCFIYVYDWYSLVYYVVYDEEMKEFGRFVEIELKEGTNRWTTQDQAWSELTVLEKLCKPLGLSHQSRIKRSLYEMVRK